MTTATSTSRQGITQKVSTALGSNAKGMFAHRSDHRLISQAQFPLHIAERIDVSLILARSAHYLGFVDGGGPVDITVSGAKFQDRTCAAGSIAKDSQGKTQYSGLQAAHIRLGSYLINGVTIANRWQQRSTELAALKGLKKSEASENMPGHAHFTALSLIFEGRTHPVDALVNQVFGTIESRLHPQLKLLNLTRIPKRQLELKIQIRGFSDAYMQTVPTQLLRIAKEMAQEIKRDPKKERTQKDILIDGHGPVFKSQGDLLNQLIAELESPTSNTNRRLAGIGGTIIKNIDFDMPLLALAKEEAKSR